jgi:hypothetical protein
MAEQHRDSARESLARAEGWRLRSLVEKGVLAGYAAAYENLDLEWVRAMQVPIRRRDRLVDRAYLAPTRRPVAEELAYLRRMAGWRDRWRYLTGYLSTDPDYVQQHGRRGPREQAGYLMGKLLSRTR